MPRDIQCPRSTIAERGEENLEGSTGNGSLQNGLLQNPWEKYLASHFICDDSRFSIRVCRYRGSHNGDNPCPFQRSVTVPRIQTLSEAKLHTAQSNSMFIQSLGLGSNIGRVSYPIAYFMSWLSAITIDLTSSFEVDCTGSVAPIYLLNISNNINIFWFTMVTECTSEFVKLLSNRFYLQTGVCKSLSTLSYVLTGFFLRIFPSPMKINQYLLSFVYISVFFANNGVSKSNKNCDAAGGSPTDTSTAVFTSLFVMFLILPMVYMFGQVLYPMPFAYEDLLEENDDDNGDDDGDSSRRA